MSGLKKKDTPIRSQGMVFFSPVFEYSSVKSLPQSAHLSTHSPIICSQNITYKSMNNKPKLPRFDSSFHNPPTADNLTEPLPNTYICRPH
jgi:hypothetical protein